MAKNFSDRVGAYQQRVDTRLDASLPSADVSPQRLHEAMRYAVFNGGKRVRPLLVYATGECLSIDPHLLDAPAVAIELFVLAIVVDQLPPLQLHGVSIRLIRTQKASRAIAEPTPSRWAWPISISMAT